MVMSPKQPWWSIWISTAPGFRPSRVVEYSCYSQIFLQFRFIELMQTHRFKRWILCEDIAPKVCNVLPKYLLVVSPFHQDVQPIWRCITKQLTPYNDFRSNSFLILRYRQTPWHILAVFLFMHGEPTKLFQRSYETEGCNLVSYLSMKS